MEQEDEPETIVRHTKSVGQSTPIALTRAPRSSDDAAESIDMLRDIELHLRKVIEIGGKVEDIVEKSRESIPSAAFEHVELVVDRALGALIELSSAIDVLRRASVEETHSYHQS